MMQEVLKNIIKLRIPGLIALAVTAVFFLIGIVAARRINARGHCNPFAMGVVGLSGRSLFHLALAWSRFALFAGFLFAASDAGNMPYIMLGMLTVALIVFNISGSNIVTELVGAAIMAGGLLLSRYLLDYINQVRSSTEIRAAYWLLCAFLVAASAVILVREFIIISGERKKFNESGEAE